MPEFALAESFRDRALAARDKRDQRRAALERNEESFAGQVRSNPGDALKAKALEGLTTAPDILGMGITGLNAASNRFKGLFGLPQGDTYPGGDISGDPIRELAGLNPSDPAVLVGESLPGPGMFAKAGATALKGMLASAPILARKVPLSAGGDPPVGLLANAGSDHGRLNRSEFIYNPDVAPLAEPNSRRLIDAGTDLQREALDVWGGKPMDMTPENLPILADNLTNEAMASFKRRPEMAGWYKANLDSAMGHAAKIHPELATDPQARDAFKVIMAITSNGQEVGTNAKLTNDYYRTYRQTGRFPIQGSGKEHLAMKSSFEAANSMVDDLGFDGFREFLSKDFTVKELKDAGFKIGGELVTTKVPGSAIFGPKIGGGFMQNLMGNFDPPTMDRWFTRTWGRHTGSLTAPPAKMDKQREALRAAIGRSKKEIKALGFDPSEVLSDPAKMDEFANAALAQFSRGGFKDKTPINNAARNLSKSLSGLNDAPTNGTQRNYMRQAMTQVRDNMRAQGVQVDTADVQALLWYAEKDLYGKMGARVNTETVDYATVWKQLAGE